MERLTHRRPTGIAGRNYYSVPQGEKWPLSVLREIFCSRITFNRRARWKILFVPHSEPRICPQTSKFPRAKPSAISRFLGKTLFLNSGTKLILYEIRNTITLEKLPEGISKG